MVRARGVLWGTLACVALTIGCGDGSAAGPDGGTSLDSGQDVDAGTSPDAGQDADGGSGPDAPTGPVTSSYGLDDGRTVTALLGPSGGELEAVATDGTRFALTVPAGALTEEVSIGITPLVELQIDGEAAGWQTGARLVPEGQVFLAPIRFEIAPAEAAPDGARLVQVDADTSLFAPPVQDEGAAAGLSHFSVYVLAAVDGGRVARAVEAAGETPTDLASLEALAGLRAAAVAEGDADAAAQAQAALISGAEAVAAEAEAGEPGFDLAGRLALGAAASREAGVGTAADRLDAAAVTVFDARLGALWAALDTVADGWSLTGDARRAVKVAEAYVPTRLDAALAFAEELVRRLMADADAGCDAGEFDAGRADLERLADLAEALGLTAPSAQELRDDAATCVPPTIEQVVATGDPMRLAEARVTTPSGVDLVRVPAEPVAVQWDDCGFIAGGGVDPLGTFEQPHHLAYASQDGHEAEWSSGAGVEADGSLLTLTLGGSASAAAIEGAATSNTQALADMDVSEYRVRVRNPRGIAVDVAVEWTVDATSSEWGTARGTGSYQVRVCGRYVQPDQPSLFGVSSTSDAGATGIRVAAEDFEVILDLALEAKANASYNAISGESRSSSAQVSAGITVGVGVGAP